jgi:superfamily I DNA/RNA helicase
MNYNNKPNILPKPSEEQIHIINSLNNNNIVVDSVAGSGKTVTNLYISKHFKKNNILLLTYNAKLKIETRQKTKLNNISNLDVHSYHSFCVKHYNKKCYRDNEINKIIVNNKNPFKLFNYDIIILDEAQDINPLYFNLIYKIFKDNNNNKTKICIVGDKYQSIYDFNNADNRFIKYAPQCFNFNKLSWKEFC